MHTLPDGTIARARDRAALRVLAMDYEPKLKRLTEYAVHKFIYPLTKPRVVFYQDAIRETAKAWEQETDEDLQAFSNDMDLADWEADHAEPHSLNRRVDYDSD